MARPSNGANLNLAELQKILSDRKKQVDKLVRKREKAQRAVERLDAEISKLAGGFVGNGRSSGGASGGGGRASNDRPLPDYIEDVLAKNGKPMKVGDIATGVQALGYRSFSAQFKNIVNQQLIKERKRFQQVSRGLYGLSKK